MTFQFIRAVPSRFDYVIDLSGYCLPGSEAGDLELQRTKPAVFWGRGSFDEVIPCGLHQPHRDLAVAAQHADRADL